jgi:hypothetical protein
MKPRALQCILAAVLFAIARSAMPHGCEPLDRYLIGHYHGDCDGETELAQGHGEARGADTYVGRWVKGKPEGKGVYTWESGARLEGLFRDGQADGQGIYVSAAGARYSGPFENGMLRTTKPSDCPSTPGPLHCN